VPDTGYRCKFHHLKFLWLHRASVVTVIYYRTNALNYTNYRNVINTLTH